MSENTGHLGRVAEAIWRADENAHEPGWWSVNEQWRDHYQRLAAAAATALRKPIFTVDQMLELPRGSIVVFADGTADQRGIDQRDGDDWSWSCAALEDLLSTGPGLLVWSPEWRAV